AEGREVRAEALVLRVVARAARRQRPGVTDQDGSGEAADARVELLVAGGGRLEARVRRLARRHTEHPGEAATVADGAVLEPEEGEHRGTDVRMVGPGADGALLRNRLGLVAHDRRGRPVEPVVRDPGAGHPQPRDVDLWRIVAVVPGEGAVDRRTLEV